MLLLLQVQLEPNFLRGWVGPGVLPLSDTWHCQVRPFISTKKIRTLPTILFMNKIQRLTVNIVDRVSPMNLELLIDKIRRKGRATPPKSNE